MIHRRPVGYRYARQINIFKRLEIIGKYRAVPYLMRYERYTDSPFAGLYKTLATYCNKGGIFKKVSFADFCRGQFQKAVTDGKPCSKWRYYSVFINEYSHIEKEYFTTHYWKDGIS